MRKTTVALIVGIIIAILSAFLPQNLARIHNYIFTTVVPLIVFVVALIVYIHSEGEMKKIGLAVALSSILSWLGEITWNYYEIIGINPFPSLADVFWISSYIPFIYILLTILKKYIRYMNLYSCIIASVLTALAVDVILFPVMCCVKGHLSPLKAFVSTLYVALDIVSIPIVILILLVYVKRRFGFIYCAIAICLALILIENVLYSYYEAWNIYYTGSLPDVFGNLCYVVILFAMYKVYSESLEIVTVEDIERERRKVKLLNKLMRHDILNDLTAIMGYLELYKESRDERLIEKIFIRIKNSINLIKSIRDVENRSELKPINLKELLERETAGYPNAEISVNVPNVSVLADELLASVFRNLIINAIVHSDEKIPKIEITARKLNGWVEIRVADNGPGIVDKEAVFKEGFGKHTGLGLYLVKMIVESYGGKVWIEDNKPKGSIFVIRLRAANRERTCL